MQAWCVGTRTASCSRMEPRGLAGVGVAGISTQAPQPGSQDAALTLLFTAPTWSSLLSSRAGVGSGEEWQRAAASSLRASSPTFLGEEDKRPAASTNPRHHANSSQPLFSP